MRLWRECARSSRLHAEAGCAVHTWRQCAITLNALYVVGSIICIFESQRVVVHTRMHCWTCFKIPLHPRGLKYLRLLVIWVSDALGDVIFTRFLFSLQLLTAAYPFLPNHRFTVFLRFSFLPPTPLSPTTVLYLSLSLSLSSPHHIADASFSTHLLSLFHPPRCRRVPILQKSIMFSRSRWIFFYIFFLSRSQLLDLLFSFKRRAQRLSCV